MESQSRLAFTLSTFFAPWYCFGFEFAGFIPLTLSSIFCFLDLKFWKNLFFDSPINRERLKWILLLLTLIFLISLRAESPHARWLTLIFLGLQTVYFYFGFKNFGISGFKYGVISAIVFAAIQFLDVNLTGSTRLAIDRFFFPITSSLSFGLHWGYGESIVQSDLWNAWMRVSGPAPEPGHFSLFLFAASLLFLNHFFVLALIGLGMVFTLSKINFVFIFCALILFLVFRPLKVPFILFLTLSCITYLILGDWIIEQAGSEAMLVKSNGSLHSRVFGVSAFQALTPWQQFIGVGLDRACEYLPKELLFFRNVPYPYSDFWNKRNCIMTAMSNVGALLTDLGVLGIFILSALVLSFRKALTLLPERYLSPDPTGWMLSWWFCGLLSVHYFTFFPISCVTLAWCFKTREQYE